MARPFIALQSPAPGAELLPLFNEIFAGADNAAAQTLWMAGAAPAQPTIPATLVCSICNCQDSPSGPAGTSGA